MASQSKEGDRDTTKKGAKVYLPKQAYKLYTSTLYSKIQIYDVK